MAFETIKSYFHSYMNSNCYSFAQSCLTLCDPMYCSMPGLLIPHYLLQWTSSCSLHLWCFPAISSSNALFSCLQSFPASRTFPMSHLFTSDDQNTGASTSASVLPVKNQDWFPLGLTDLLEVQGTLKSLLQHHSSKASILQCSAFFTVQISHPYMTMVENIALTRQTFVGKVMSLLFNMLSRLVIAFLPRSKRLLISWPQLPSAVILEPKKIKSLTVSIVSPSICHKVMGPGAMIFVFRMLSFRPKDLSLDPCKTLFPEFWRSWFWQL